MASFSGFFADSDSNSSDGDVAPIGYESPLEPALLNGSSDGGVAEGDQGGPVGFPAFGRRGPRTVDDVLEAFPPRTRLIAYGMLTTRDPATLGDLIPLVWNEPVRGRDSRVFIGYFLGAVPSGRVRGAKRIVLTRILDVTNNELIASRSLIKMDVGTFRKSVTQLTEDFARDNKLPTPFGVAASVVVQGHILPLQKDVGFVREFRDEFGLLRSTPGDATLWDARVGFRWSSRAVSVDVGDVLELPTRRRGQSFDYVVPFVALDVGRIRNLQRGPWQTLIAFFEIVRAGARSLKEDRDTGGVYPTKKETLAFIDGLIPDLRKAEAADAAESSETASTAATDQDAEAAAIVDALIDAAGVLRAALAAHFSQRRRV